MAFLEVNSPRWTRRIEFGGEPISVGRHPDNEIQYNDDGLSRKHCLFERRPDGWWIQDLGSRNGTKLNGVRVANAALTSGDVVRVGNLEIRFMAPESSPKPGRSPDAGARNAATVDAASRTPSESLILQARGPGWKKVAFDMVSRYLLDLPWRLRSLRDRRLVLGGALVGALRRSMLDRNMPLWLNTPFESFITDDAGAVTGVIAKRDGVSARIRARKGVILASGGFEKSEEMRKQYLDQPTDPRWSAGSPGNTGEVIRIAAEQLGAGLEFMDEGWWGPTVMMPGEPQARMLIIEKNLPGSIIVNRAGKRFVNESSSYTKVIRGIFAANRPGEESIPAYMIFDATYRGRFPIGPMLPSNFQPDWAVSSSVKEAIPSAPDVRTLAGKLGIDPEGLAKTVSDFNGYARNGKDPDFQRGDANYDRYYGYPHELPNPCLGPLDKAPFYGVRIYPGELGTKGGVAVDARARALRADGSVIEGLYAIGNCSSPVTGSTYPASGSTLAPAMVFGYVAGADVAGR
jgi:3-oxosteroid 1-dehydrogenase